jgi:hypothetical protein
MKTRIVLLLTFFLLISSLSYANDIDSVLTKKYGSEQLVEDFDYIKTNVLTKKYNRTPYLFIRQEDFERGCDSIKRIINREGQMSLFDFYTLTTPFLSSICDDHLNFIFSGPWDYINKDIKVYDNKIMWAASAYFINNKIYITGSSEIPAKSRVISVEDIPDTILIKELLRYQQYSLQRYYKAHRAVPINFYVNALIMYKIFGMKDNITVKFKRSETAKVETVTIELKKYNDFQQVSQLREKLRNNNYDLSFDGRTAILKLNTFNYRNFNDGINNYNQIFKTIKENESQNLIIDVSQNGGGSDLNWFTFLRYITKLPVQLNCNAPKLEIKEALIQSKIDQSKIDTALFFSGDIYLVTGPRSFSSAVRFADVMKSNLLCKNVIGQETLGQATHYGEAKTSNLPNTKLVITVSSKLFYSINCNTDKSGVMPDLEVPLKTVEDYMNYFQSGFAIKKALNLIK